MLERDLAVIFEYSLYPAMIASVSWRNIWREDWVRWSVCMQDCACVRGEGEA